MSKRKNINDIDFESKFQKLTLSHQIKNSYICQVHNNSPEICRIYECSGFSKKNHENLLKYYIK